MAEDDIATRIQAGYKGMIAREEFKDLRDTDDSRYELPMIILTSSHCFKFNYVERRPGD